MAARVARFTEADIKRAVKGVRASGVRDAQVLIAPDGSISIVMGAAAKNVARANTCDDLLD